MVAIDLFKLDEAKAKARLLNAVAAAASGRMKPDAKPGFPGSGRAIPRQALFPEALPNVWKVPAQNPNFTGRADDLDQLEQGLAAGQSVTVHSVHGMGGVGKTQLVTEYAHLKASLYDVAWWVDAETSATIPDQFAALAEQLGLEPATDPERLQAQVHVALRHVPGWLLILDNADRVDAYDPGYPRSQCHQEHRDT